MKPVASSIAFSVLALCVLFLVVPAAMAADTRTLEGEFIWERDDKDIAGPLKAVFESTGEDMWNVSFHFTFEDKPHVYTGTAKGNLKDGELTGEVLSDGEEQHPYAFSGTFAEDGSFSGTHDYIDGEEARETGKIALAR